MPKGLLKFVANKPYKFHVEVMMFVDKINLFSPWFFVVFRTRVRVRIEKLMRNFALMPNDTFTTDMED